ncbi:MAG TPA: isoprenylcysteine carboxylmethyltransferase family protein [Blastocatellia bacterium]|nr:isoprenylcysteine carboxylmethyltransferase family protein [Blastocatellia bacterium]
MDRTNTVMNFRQVAQSIRVPAGFALAPLLLIAARPTPTTLIVGAMVAAVGLAIRAWASGYLKKDMELATAGPYAHTRNPLYLGTFLLGVGVSVGSGAVWFVALFMALYLLIYVPVMQAEVASVRRLFPQEYDDYARRVPLFLPRLMPYRTSSDDKQFDTSLYMRHREYRAAIGAALVFAILAAKYYLHTQQT